MSLGDNAKGRALGLALGFVLALVCVLSGGCGDTERVAARVGGGVVNEGELQHWAAVASTLPPSEHPPSRRQLLDFLIRAAWTSKEARALGLRVSDGEVSAQLSFLRFAQARGLPMRQLPHEATLRGLLLSDEAAKDAQSLTRTAMLTAKLESHWTAAAMPKVSKRAVANYYKAHRRQFVRPAVSDIEIIGNHSETIVARARREIEAGAPFLSVAGRSSEDPEAENGLQHLVEGTEEPDFEREIFGTRPHVLTGPIHQILWYLFVVLSAKPAQLEPLSESEQRIRRTLAPPIVEAALRPAFERRWKAETTCEAGLTSPLCGSKRSA